MSLCSSLGQFILVVLNCIFVFVSFGIIAVGIVLKFFPGEIFQFLFDVIRGTVPFNLPESWTDLDIVPIVDQIGLSLIILGVLLCSLCFFACCGACCKWRVFLVLFCIVMIILIIIIGTVGGLFLTRDSKLNTDIKNRLVQRVHDEYKGPRGNDVFTLAIHIISYSLNCCAIAGPGDFNEQADWTNQEYQGIKFKLNTSPACCQRIYFDTGRLDQCAVKPFTEDRVHMTGCYVKLMDLIQEQRTWAILGLTLVLVFLAVEVILAIILIREIQKKSLMPI